MNNVNTLSILDPPLLIMHESAHLLYLEALTAVCNGEETNSVKNNRSVGSFWGTKERPTREIRYATLILNNSRHRMVASPFFNLEKILPRTILATLSDEIYVDALAFYDPKAVEFSENGKVISTNYGYRIRHLDQIDQIQQVIKQLKDDPFTRRAIIHIHSPHDAECKYNPCIDSIHFLIRNGVLECRTSWRSENALTLLPLNIFEFSMLQELIASELGIPPGRYVHTVSSLHIYLDDLERAQTVLQSMSSLPSPPEMASMPKHSLKQIDLIRNIEKKWRTEKALDDEWGNLSSYWQDIATSIEKAIKSRLR